MPVLECPKMEKYAQMRAKGKTQLESYVVAGFEANESHACRYEVSNGKIKERIAELTEEASKTAAEQLGLDHKWWLKEMLINTQMSRELEQMGASNVALNSIGKHLKVHDDGLSEIGGGLIINIGVDDE